MKKYKAHILMVDDDDRIRELVKQYLYDNNYLVTTANSSEDAKKKVDIVKFDRQFLQAVAKLIDRIAAEFDKLKYLLIQQSAVFWFYILTTEYAS